MFKNCESQAYSLPLIFRILGYFLNMGANSCSFNKLGRFCFNTVERMLAYGYFRKNAFSFKAHVSIQCIVKLSIRIDYPFPSTLFSFYFIRHSQFESMYLLFDNSRVFFFYSSDGKLLEVWSPQPVYVRGGHQQL